MDISYFTTLMITIIAGVFAIYKFIRDDMKLMNAQHREDMGTMADRLILMDQKWERLFEKLLIKEQK